MSGNVTRRNVHISPIQIGQEPLYTRIPENEFVIVAFF